MESVRAAAKPRWPFPALAFQPAGFPALAAMAGAVRSSPLVQRRLSAPFDPLSVLFSSAAAKCAIWSARALLNEGRSVARLT